MFRLWAPMAGEVALCLRDETGAWNYPPMAGKADGWFELHHQAAKAGDRYQFQIDGRFRVPDPASRCQEGDIHGPSIVCDPLAYAWNDRDWRGRPWEEAVIYELHVGAFSPQGTFDGVRERLDYLCDLGVTAIELMPVSQFPGRCNWGYDGALLYAPCNRYGTPEDFKNLVAEAHRKGLMVFLDVVYNHFGPEGNYLHVYARDAFFTEEFQTPWGAALRFSGPDSGWVRKFFVANALYWLEEFHLDGLRFDAAHAIFDPSEPDILEEIALAVRQGPGRARHIHLQIENDNNRARYIERKADGSPRLFTAQWNDDIHHACHVLLTGEEEGYYADYRHRPIEHLARCLTEGFAYQGEVSGYRSGRVRGDSSAHLPPLAFVSFLQNHDQIGNRAFGERLSLLTVPDELRLFLALLLLAPQPPLLFMGEEFNSTSPFFFFCDFGPELAENVTAGRRAEFSGFPQFSSRESRERIPDPNAEETFQLSQLDWDKLALSENVEHLLLYKELLTIRRQEIVPRLKSMTENRSGCRILAKKALQAWWRMGDGSTLTVLLNLHRHAVKLSAPLPAAHRVLFRPAGSSRASPREKLPPTSILWILQEEGGEDG